MRRRQWVAKATAANARRRLFEMAGRAHAQAPTIARAACCVTHFSKPA